MTTSHQVSREAQPQNPGKTIVWGAGLAFLLISAFIAFLYLIGKDEGPGIEILVPVLTATIGGACGGLFYYLMGYVRMYGGWKKVMADIISVFVYIIGVWLSLVYGLSLIGLWH